jgi:hypothetical protein
MKVNHLPFNRIHGIISQRIALFTSRNGYHNVSEVFMSAICIVQCLQSDTHIWLQSTIHHINFPRIHTHNVNSPVTRIKWVKFHARSVATTHIALYDHKICTVQRTLPKHMCHYINLHWLYNILL